MNWAHILIYGLIGAAGALVAFLGAVLHEKKSKPSGLLVTAEDKQVTVRELSTGKSWPGVVRVDYEGNVWVSFNSSDEPVVAWGAITTTNLPTPIALKKITSGSISAEEITNSLLTAEPIRTEPLGLPPEDRQQ